MGGKWEIVGRLTRIGGCQEWLKRFDQIVKEERRASFDTLFLMNFFCVLGKPNLISI